MWLAIDHYLYQFDLATSNLQDSYFDEGIKAIALDQQRGLLWVAGNTTLNTIDHQQNIIPQNLILTDDTEIRAIAFDNATDQLYIAHLNSVIQYSAETLTPTLTIPIEKKIRHLATDTQGGIWVAAAKYLYRFDTQGQVLVSRKLFKQKKGGIKNIIVNPYNGHLWAAAKRAVRQLDDTGQVLAKWSYKKGKKHGVIKDLALFMPISTSLGVLQITAPLDNAKLKAPPLVEIQFNEFIQAQDITLSLDEILLDLFIPCAPQDIGIITCLITKAMADGEHTLAANALDEAGQLTTDQVTFYLDRTPPNIPDIRKITASDIVNDKATITGDINSVEPLVTVRLSNPKNQAIKTTTSDNQGQFSTDITLTSGDTIHIMAIDDVGNQSSAVQLQVGQPTLQIEITSPANGATITRSTITVEGIVQGSSAVLVNDQLAKVHNGKFWLSNLPTPADNVIKATTTTIDNQQKTAFININYQPSTEPELTLSAYPELGVAPLDVSFNYTFSQPENIKKITIDYEGDGQTDIDTTNLSTTLQHTYNAVGTYTVKLTITDNNDQTYNDQATVIAVDLFEHIKRVDDALRNTHNQLISNLRSGNIENALNSFQPNVREHYQTLLTEMATELPALLAQPYTLHSHQFIGDRIAEYYLVREEEGILYAYPISFFRGSDGIWRIVGM